MKTFASVGRWTWIKRAAGRRISSETRSASSGTKKKWNSVIRTGQSARIYIRIPSRNEFSEKREKETGADLRVLTLANQIRACPTRKIELRCFEKS